MYTAEKTLHSCPCVSMAVLQNGFSQNIKISADHDDFLTFHTREKSRLTYANVRLLAVLAWRGISCVCDGAGGEIQKYRFGSDTGRACDGAVKNEVKNFPLVDTGRACDGAGLAYADMVRRKGRSMLPSQTS